AAAGDSLELPRDSRSPIAAEPAVTPDALRHDDPQREMRPPKRLPDNESAAPPHSSRPLPLGRPVAIIQDAAEFAAGDGGSTVARPRAGSDTPAAEQAFQSKTSPDMTAPVRSGVTVRADSLGKHVDPEHPLR